MYVPPLTYKIIASIKCVATIQTVQQHTYTYIATRSVTAPQTGQYPVPMADVRHTKLSVLFTVLGDSHDTLTLGLD